MGQRSMKQRDRETAKGLLPRMEARPWTDGKTITYRYHPLGATKPLNLGTDRLAAMRKVLELIGKSDDAGTIGRLWEQYKESPAWNDLKPRTRADYEEYSVKMLEFFGKAPASEITAPHVAKYLRQFRANAPIRANREIALLGNLIGLAIERGEALTNPCRGGQVKRNKERPLDVLPDVADIEALVRFAAARDVAVKTKIGRSVVVMMAAEFAALTGARQAEFLPLAWPAFDESEVRLERAKQRLGVKKVDRIAVSPALGALRGRLLAVQTSPMGAVFPNRRGNVYTADGFATMWQKLMTAAIEAGEVKQRFNFHALRAYYATQHKVDTGALPDMHASPTTTAKIYERSKTARRKAL
jgi:site-specific recombinase XerD